MPMHRDEKGGGTNADGSRNAMYCSHCYEGGNFTLPNLSAEEMKSRVKEKLKGAGVPAPAVWFFTRNIPKLARWRTRKAATE